MVKSLVLRLLHAGNAIRMCLLFPLYNTSQCLHGEFDAVMLIVIIENQFLHSRSSCIYFVKSCFCTY